MPVLGVASRLLLTLPITGRDGEVYLLRASVLRCAARADGTRSGPG
ncbi:hypothetical protein ACSNOI_23305 [Actinomadura kijaniata]